MSTQTDHFVDPSLFVPDSAKENYAEGARLAAKQNGTTVADEWAKTIAQFERNHESDGAAGWNHLANWAKTADPEDFLVPDSTEVRKAAALASAIQDETIAATVRAVSSVEDGAADLVDHAHATNAARFESTPGSPAGADPANVEADPATPEGGDGSTPAERESGTPTRTATPPKKTTR